MMMRRLIAVVAILAVALAYVPGMVGDVMASAMNCCNGTLCPMHNTSMHQADTHVECDMDMAHSAAALQSCPDNAPRYITAVAFVCVTPTIFFQERVVSVADAFVSHVVLNADLAISPRPPRTSVA